MHFRLRLRRRAVVLLLSAAFGLHAQARAASGQEAAWTTNGPAGGSVYCLVPDPSRPSTLYAGTVEGVFKSDDGGASWRAASAGMPSARVQTIAIDPSASSTLYAGTLTPNGVDSVGIFKSTDGGVSWTAINEGLFDPLTGVSPLDIWSLAIDPKNSGTILAGSRFSEIFKSVDGGVTWQYKTFGGFQVALETSAFQFDPSSSSRILAATTVGLLRSTDGGESWGGYGNVNDSFFTLIADPTVSTTLYAGNIAGTGVFKSTDSGAHWTTINKGLPSNQGATGALPLVLGFAVDPSRPTNLYAGTYGNGLYRSTDGGLNWSPANGAMRTSYVAAIFIGQSSTLFAGTLGGGVYRSADNAGTWTPSNAGLDIALVASLLADPATPGTVYVAAFDGVYKSADGGGTWLGVNNGLPIAPVSALASRSGNPRTLLASTLGSGVWKSTDGGATWTSSAQGMTDSFISSLVVDPSNSLTLYAGTNDSGASSQRVFKSADGGATWTQTSLDAGQLPITFLAVNPANASQVIAISENALGYFQSLDAGKTWSTVTTDSSCGGVNTIFFDSAGSTLSVGGTTGLCRSGDGGKTWTPTPVGSLASVETFLIDPSSSSTIYAGTSPAVPGGTGGVFRSTDGGQTWEVLGNGLSGASVVALSIDAVRGILHAGIHGGSVAELAFVRDRARIQPLPPAGQGTRRIPPR
jgi:Sortilin, neurotensin receptor 3,/BNR/Asp-box repeat